MQITDGAPKLVDDPDNVIYLNAAVRDSWNKLYSHVPVFHISKRTLSELESVTSIEINAGYVGKKRCAIAIAVDDAIPIVMPDDALGSASTETLLLDAHSNVWRFYERARIQRPHHDAGTQVVGVVWGLRKRYYGPDASDTFGYRSMNALNLWSVGEQDTGRIIRTVLALLWLCEHDQVTFTDVGVIGGQRHSIVDVPIDLSVEKAIADLLQGKHVRQHPSRISQLVTAASRLMKARTSRRSSVEGRA
jgi:hypothetical protein